MALTARSSAGAEGGATAAAGVGAANTASAAGGGGGGGGGGKTQAEVDIATRDALTLVFSAEGNYLQEIVVEEAVRAADALTRGGAPHLHTRAQSACFSSSDENTINRLQGLLSTPTCNSALATVLYTINHLRFCRQYHHAIQPLERIHHNLL